MKTALSWSAGIIAVTFLTTVALMRIAEYRDSQAAEMEYRELLISAELRAGIWKLEYLRPGRLRFTTLEYASVRVPPSRWAVKWCRM